MTAKKNITDMAESVRGRLVNQHLVPCTAPGVRRSRTGRGHPKDLRPATDGNPPGVADRAEFGVLGRGVPSGVVAGILEKGRENGPGGVP